MKPRIHETHEKNGQMTKFLDSANAEADTPGFGGYAEPVRRSRAKKIVLTILAVLASLLIVSSIAGYFYWQSFKSTPQYSLALLVDAARRDDQAAIDQFVVIDTIVDEFMPQITGKAVELYGRGLPPQTIARVEKVATPLMPALKQRARAQLPTL